MDSELLGLRGDEQGSSESARECFSLHYVPPCNLSDPPLGSALLVKMIPSPARFETCSSRCMDRDEMLIPFRRRAPGRSQIVLEGVMRCWATQESWQGCNNFICSLVFLLFSFTFLFHLSVLTTFLF
jgi:hypothetical protein